MYLNDSNIVIYLAKGEFSEELEFLLEHPFQVSIITKIEVLGYHKLLDQEKSYFSKFFDKVPIIQLNRSIAETAIELKQRQKMTLGDAVIAATSLEHKLEMVTRNDKDFRAIEGLSILNPILR